MSQSRATASAAAILSDYIVRHNMRRTPERMAIMEAAVDMPSHFTPYELSDSLRSSGHNYSLTTIYSSLSLLVDAGIIRMLTLDDRGQLYERSARIGGNVRTRRPHHHLVCTSCGKIIETRLPGLTFDSISSDMGKEAAGFEARELSLTVYGLCCRCARKTHPRPDTPARPR